MLAELSMGMSHDYEIAIEEGATLVRVGHRYFRHAARLSDPCRPFADAADKPSGAVTRMNVSPMDLRQQRFHTRFRGFDKIEVTALLAAVAEDYEQALRETDRLRQEVSTHGGPAQRAPRARAQPSGDADDGADGCPTTSKRPPKRKPTASFATPAAARS